ncbi:TPA: Flavin-containing monooxygenase FMO GS-OX5 [Trebouxia sp. C0006]
MVKNDTNQLNVAVIGAGAAGLVATRELLREGHQVTAFEQNHNVGGIWDYQEECETEDLLGRNPNRRHVHSSMYSSLRTNLPRQIMSFSDFPFIPEVMGDRSHDSRRFPSHTEVQAWLEVFAAKFQLRQHISFNSQIVSLRPITSAASNSGSELPASVKTAPRWKLTVQTAASKHAAQHAEQAPCATEANGAKSHAKPAGPSASPPTADNDSLAADVHASLEASSEPAEADDSASRYPDSNRFHSRHDRDKQNCSRHDSTANGCSSRFADQHTPAHSSHTPPDSEHQNSAESRHAAESQSGPSGCTEYDFDAVVVCVGNYHQPNLPQVKGMDDFTGLQMHAHNYRSSSMFAGMRVIVVGASFSGEELARAIADVACHVFHSARSFQESTPRDIITRVAMLTELSSDGMASFQDGTQIANIDAVIYCTGYQYAYPFLEGTGLVTSHDMRVDPLWQHIFPPNVAPTLSFVGLIWKSLRNPQFELQSKLVARVLSGRAQLPSRLQMAQDVADFYQQLIDCGVPVRYTHNQTDIMPVNQWAYNAKLAEICGPDVPKQPDWLQALYAVTSVHILGRPDSFRDEWGPQEIAVYDTADKFCTQMIQELHA